VDGLLQTSIHHFLSPFKAKAPQKQCDAFIFFI